MVVVNNLAVGLPDIRLLILEDKSILRPPNALDDEEDQCFVGK